MKYLKYLLPLFLSLLISSVSTAQSKKFNYLDAINIADKQRTLIQQMAKDKLFIEVNKKSNESEKDMKNAITEFELAIEILKDFAPNDNVKYKIEIEELTFKTYKMFLLETTKKSMNEVISMNTLFLKICDEVFENFLKHSGENQKNKKDSSSFKNINKLANASGTVRYLTQRLSFYYAINYYEIKTIYPDEINTIIKRVDNALNFMTISEFNTLDIDDSLSKVLYYWSSLKVKMANSGFDKNGLSKIDPEKLYDLSDVVLMKANPITKMYLEIAR
ncbi:hypothetical protein ACXGQW_07725 [Wenyingzhuangia sp. IMCC45533]